MALPHTGLMGVNHMPVIHRFTSSEHSTTRHHCCSQGQPARRRSSNVSSVAESTPILAEEGLASSPTRSNSEHNGYGAIDRSGVPEPVPPPRRLMPWLAMLGFCYLAFVQAATFVEWNPVANSAMQAYSWNSTEIAWQANIATFLAPIIQFPVWAVINNTANLGKLLTFLAALPMCIGTGARWIALISDASDITFTWLTNLSSLITGITGLVFFTTITRFSAIWFNEDTRCFATGLAMCAANFGSIFPSIVGPAMVQEDIPSPEIRMQMQNYLAIFFGLSGGLLLVFILLFHIRDHVRPGFTDGQPRYDWAIGLLHLLKDRNSFALMISYGAGSVPIFWSMTLVTIAMDSKDVGIPQDHICIFTVLSVVVSVLLTLCATKAVDKLQFSLKWTTACLTVLHILALMTLCFVLDPDWGYQDHVYVTFIGLLFVVQCSFRLTCNPLILEFAAKITRPVPEDLSAGLYNISANVLGTIFYFSFIVDGGEFYKQALFMIVASIMSFVLLLCVKENGPDGGLHGNTVMSTPFRNPAELEDPETSSGGPEIRRTLFASKDTSPEREPEQLWDVDD